MINVGDNNTQIKFFYGLSWIIEAGAPPEEDLSYRFSSRENRDEYFWLAKLLRSYPGRVKYDGVEGEPFMIEHKNLFIIGSPQRPYSERVYDCAKSDILVLAPIELKVEAIRVFEEKVSNAKNEKSNVYTYINNIQKTLDALTTSGLIDGVLGRGSYFDPNGLPVPNDDIDFILLRKAPRDEESTAKIKEILRGIDGDVEILIRTVEHVKESDSKPSYSFLLFDTYRAYRSKGTNYERYILLYGPGIETKNVSKEDAEKVAKEIESYIPRREHIQ